MRPSVFDIFSPPILMNPCTKMERGAGIPADHSIDGHSRQWNREMSLPMMCSALGSAVATPSSPGAHHHSR